MIKQISVKSIVLLNIQGNCDNEEPLIIYIYIDAIYKGQNILVSDKTSQRNCFKKKKTHHIAPYTFLPNILHAVLLKSYSKSFRRSERDCLT